MENLGAALRRKLSQRMNSLLSKKSGDLSNLIISDEITVIQENGGTGILKNSLDKIIVDLDVGGGHDAIIDLIDTEFYERKKNPDGFLRLASQVESSAFDSENFTDLEDDNTNNKGTRNMAKSFYSTQMLSGNVRPATQTHSTNFLKRR